MTPSGGRRPGAGRKRPGESNEPIDDVLYVRINSVQAEWLRRTASAENISVSAFIRRMIAREIIDGRQHQPDSPSKVP